MLAGLSVAGLTLLSGCGRGDRAADTSAQTLVQVHSVGAARVAADASSAKLRSVWSLPETRALYDQTLNRLALSPRVFYPGALSANEEGRGAALARPLIEDALAKETFLLARGPDGQFPEWTVAIATGPQDAGLWRTNLPRLAEAWRLGTPAAIKVQGYAGQEIRRTTSPKLVRWVEAGPWVLVGLGDGPLAGVEEAARRIKSAGRPVAVLTNSWVMMDLNLPRLRDALGWSAGLPWPRARGSISGREEYVRTALQLQFASPVTPALPAWVLPTNLVREPLISFTAARGVASWVGGLPFVSDLKLPELPDEFFMWGLRDATFGSFLAFPAKDPTNVISRVAEQGQKAIVDPIERKHLTRLQQRADPPIVIWQGLPILVPFARVAALDQPGWVHGGFVPLVRSNAPAVEVFTQLTRSTNTVYYDWEITQDRLHQWFVMSQLFAVLADQSQLTTNMPAKAWLEKIPTQLGNTVTEVTAQGPAEWSFARKSHLGFTGFELVQLGRWLESTNFPKLSLQLPPPPPRPQPAPKPPR
jgi:hypothetical protein